MFGLSGLAMKAIGVVLVLGILGGIVWEWNHKNDQIIELSADLKNATAVIEDVKKKFGVLEETQNKINTKLQEHSFILADVKKKFRDAGKLPLAEHEKVLQLDYQQRLRCIEIITGSPLHEGEQMPPNCKVEKEQ